MSTRSFVTCTSILASALLLCCNGADLPSPAATLEPNGGAVGRSGSSSVGGSAGALASGGSPAAAGNSTVQSSGGSAGAGASIGGASTGAGGTGGLGGVAATGGFAASGGAAPGDDGSLGTGDVVPDGKTHVAPKGGLNPAADASFAAYNKAFLVSSGGKTFYKQSIAETDADGTWVGSLDILVAEDAYERTGSAANKTLVNDLCTTWLKNTPTPWDWDGWNDDIGWFTLALVRGYQITGNASFLTAVKYGFDMAWARGWDTKYNGGGIWEQQPEKTPAGQAINKEALSNDSLGKVASIIYQTTHDQSYLDKAIQIDDWVWHHVYEPSTGLVDAGIDRTDTVNHSPDVYNQGTFADFSNLLYEITGNVNYSNDAKKAIDYVKSTMTTNGVISNSATYLNTWADEFARGAGHFTRDNRQWDTYYAWFVQNAQAIANNSRTDSDLTWNGWAQKTPNDDTLITSKFDSAVAWLQFTPTAKPDRTGGIHMIVSQEDGVAVDNGGQSADGTGIVQSALASVQSQKWLLTQNDDTSWNVVSLSSWKALTVPAGNKAIGTQMVQATATRDDTQRWWLDQQADGSYEISNKATGGALVNTSSVASDCSSASSCKLVQTSFSGSKRQLWLLQ